MDEPTMCAVYDARLTRLQRCINEQPAAAERNPGKIAASHRAQAGDQLSPEQYQDKPVVPHWSVIMFPMLK
ncbi:hypothetical protein [Mesorhizobium sp. WSM4310]|uniref:hypothetical protein n=1 Tax=Mesorhizobium sp. WSM4310 TaxID=2589883 RepID=UPI00163DCE1C|nr:hypothetical protein [Mesorhizobium sp. WSM4310]